MRETLSDYINVPRSIRPGVSIETAKGLMVLTDNGRLQAQIYQSQAQDAKNLLGAGRGVAGCGGAANNFAAGRVALKDGLHRRRRKRGRLDEPPGPVAAHAANPRAQINPGLLDRTDHNGRSQSPGATDDSGGRASDPAAHPLWRRQLDARWPRDRDLARGLALCQDAPWSCLNVVWRLPGRPASHASGIDRACPLAMSR